MYFTFALICFGTGALCWMLRRLLRRNMPFGLADGLGFFCACMVLFLLTAPQLQYTYGLWGLLWTELLLLLPALLMPHMAGVKAREFFQLRFPTARHTMGGLLLWLGTVIGLTLPSSLMLMIFPKLAENLQEVSDFVSSDTLTLSIAAAVLAPSICEEMMHRGVILASVRQKYRESFVVVLMGVIFGLFHMDAARFLSTALLGMTLSYAALRSRSILLPMLLHFVNNLFSVAVTFLSRDLNTETESIVENTPLNITEIAGLLSTQIIIALLSLTLLIPGYLLLRGEYRPPFRRHPMVIIAAGMVLAVAAQGVILLCRPGG